MRIVKDCKGRNMEGSVLLYGDFMRITDDNRESIRNHELKVRVRGSIPKKGRYYTPYELRGILKSNSMNMNLSDINMNFRNVQYLYDKFHEHIFWVYAIRESNLEGFDFLGNDLSLSTVDKLMTINEYELGFAHATKSNKIKIYYNRQRSIVVILDYEYAYRADVGVGIYRSKSVNVVYRPFESMYPHETDFTGFLFNSSMQTIPIYTSEEALEITCGCSYNKNIAWTQFLDRDYIDGDNAIDDDSIAIGSAIVGIDKFNTFRSLFGLEPDKE